MLRVLPARLLRDPSQVPESTLVGWGGRWCVSKAQEQAGSAAGRVCAPRMVVFLICGEVEGYSQLLLLIGEAH